MSESIEDQVSRLRAMSMCSPVSGTDLDQDGIAAIKLAVRVLSVIQQADKEEATIDTYFVDYAGGTGPRVLQAGTQESYGET